VTIRLPTLPTLSHIGWKYVLEGAISEDGNCTATVACFFRPDHVCSFARPLTRRDGDYRRAHRRKHPQSWNDLGRTQVCVLIESFFC
jgi:hypothetical protein